MKLRTIGSLAVTALVMGCSLEHMPARHDFNAEAFRDEAAAGKGLAAPDERMDWSGQDVPLRDLLTALVDKFGVSVVADAADYDKLVSGDFRASSLLEILNSLARQLGNRVSKVGSIYYIGAPGSSASSVVVGRFAGLDASGTTELLHSIVSAVGKVWVSPTGLFVLSDDGETAAKVGELEDQFAASAEGLWQVDLYFFGYTVDGKLHAGVDIEPTGTASFNLMAWSQSSEIKSAELAFQAFADATYTHQLGATEGSDQLLVRLGQPATFKNATVIPVPITAVSDQGTVTTQRYDEVNVGDVVTVSLGLGGEGRATLKLSVEQSQLEGYVGTAPIKADVSLETSADVRIGGYYLVGRIKSSAGQRGRTGLGGLVFDTAQTDIYRDVWARVRRVEVSKTD